MSPSFRSRYLAEVTVMKRPKAWQCSCPGLRPRQRHHERWECLPIMATRAEQALSWLAQEFSRR